MQGEEEQVVLICFNDVSTLNLAPFPRLEYKLSRLHREKCHQCLHSIYSSALLPSLPPQAALVTSPTTCTSGNVFNLQQWMRLHTLKRQGEAEGS